MTIFLDAGSFAGISTNLKSPILFSGINEGIVTDLDQEPSEFTDIGTTSLSPPTN